MKLQVFGFAIIVAVALAGVDYSMQARATEQPLGMTAYIDTISGRFQAANAARALKSRQKQEVKIHLPEAPEGWSRHEWAETDTARITAITDGLSGWDKRALSVNELAPMMGGMAVAGVKLADRMQRKTIWVYERGDEIIALRVIYTKTGAPKRFPGMDAKIDAANIKGRNSAAPYAMVQGVGFGEVQVERKLTGPVTYRSFSASMGSNIMIAVRAQASDASILTMMDAINYDGLNGMLDVALTGVGTAAAGIEPVQAATLAAPVVETTQDVIPSLVEVAVQKAIGIGFDTVTSMPGQKCVRKAGSRICGGFTTD